MVKRKKFYSENTNRLPTKPNSAFKNFRQVIQKCHMMYVLVPADKAANNVVVVCRLHFIKTLKQDARLTNRHLLMRSL